LRREPDRDVSADVEQAGELMQRFAERTGLGLAHPARRYLWTDAFAVCNFLALRRATGAARWQALALATVGQVHRVLGRHRPDDTRRGWLSGLAEEEGERHPTRGGLRIGKPLPERSRTAPFDERLEWERDGQYFHYLTRWMHALDQLARVTGDAHYNTWARELADTAHRAFTQRARGGPLHMCWKLSIDLSRPLVASMGQHDPLDGLVTCLALQATARQLPGAPPEPALEQARADFAVLARGSDWTTADPLGVGGLLLDAARIAQLGPELERAFPGLLETLLAAAHAGLEQCVRSRMLDQPAVQRLAFRELGLALGLSALDVLASAAERCKPLGPLVRHASLGRAITSFWRAPAHRSSALWQQHGDINDVMLASCLLPEGVVRRLPLAAGAEQGRA
jgi:hypothetical protein